MDRNDSWIVLVVRYNFVHTFQQILREHAAACSVPFHRQHLIEERRGSVESDDLTRWNDDNYSIDVEIQRCRRCERL